jgi:hypothetical protein
MDLHRKAAISGLDLVSPGRARATLGVIPRGKNISFRDAEGNLHDSGYTFPVVRTLSGLRALVEHALRTLATAHALGPLSVARFLVTAHSGGGASLMRLLSATRRSDLDPHEIEVFDALYGPCDQLIAWAARRIQRDGQAPGSLRVLYLPGMGTEAESLRVHRALPELLGRDVARLEPRYRVEAVHGVLHDHIPRHFGGRLLARSDADLSPEARSPGATRASGAREAPPLHHRSG